MIISWLVGELTDLFTKNSNVSVVLWFDAKEEYAGLLDSGIFPVKDSGFTLLRYRLDEKKQVYHGPLWLKAQMVWETRHLPVEEKAACRFVLYLPFAKELLDSDTPEVRWESLLEYKYTGKTWLLDGKEPSLFQFLRKHGVPLPSSQKEQRALGEGGNVSLLAKMVTKFAERDAAFWKQSLNAAKVTELLVGDLPQKLFLVLADPENAVAYLTEKNLLDEFTQAVVNEYAYEAPLAADARAWVQGFTLRLALTECFLGYGQPADFPFLSLLPDANVRDHWVSFWKRWTSDRDLAAVYDKCIALLEADYNLTAWAKGRTGSSQAFNHLARAQWNEEFAVFEKIADSRTQLETYATSHISTLQSATIGYWANTSGKLPGWALLAELCSLVIQARQALNESEKLLEPSDFVSAYTARWYKADASYWHIFQGVRRSVGLEAIQKAANLCYRYFLQEVNTLFVSRFSTWSSWGQWGEQSVLAGSPNVWNAKGKVAVLVVDALRYDLAAALKEQIKGADTELSAWITEIPSITPVGMTALLPLKGEAVNAVLSTGKLELLLTGVGDLAVKEKRRQLLAERCGATFLELPDLLSSPRLPSTKFLVVFTSEIDGLGHKTGVELSKHLDQLLADLRIAIEKLHLAGFETVHVIADHGFILLADGSDKVESVTKHAVLKGDRYAFLADGAVVDQLTLPFSLDEKQRVAFPHGIACFSGNNEYIHGGLSLQEIVVPHLKTWTTHKSEKIDVECILPTTEIATLTVKVVLVAKSPVAANLLDQPQGRTMEVTFMRNGVPVALANTVSLDPDEKDGTKSVTVFLDESIGFSKGDVLALQVRDVDTKEDLATGKTVTLVRDLGN